MENVEKVRSRQVSKSQRKKLEESGKISDLKILKKGLLTYGCHVFGLRAFFSKQYPVFAEYC